MRKPTYRNGRTPTTEELRLWRYVTRNDQPLRLEAEEEDAPLPFEEESDTSPARSKSRTRTAILPSGLSAPASVMPLQCGVYAGVDAATAQRLKRGRYPIDARLDLHGMTREQAFDALRKKLETAFESGQRCLLVITGKGTARTRQPAVETGILKSLLPDWLNQDMLRRYLLAYEQAHISHGGAGAYYLLIRRKREGR